MAALASQVEALGIGNLVVDPVMVSRSGDRLIDEGAIAFLRDVLIPMAAVVTPNRFEAQILSGLEIVSLDDMPAAAQQIYCLGAKAVLVKGGGMNGDLRGIDVWFDGTRLDVLKVVCNNSLHLF